MIVRIAASVACLYDRTCPSSIETVFRSAVEGAVSVSLIECNEQRRSGVLECIATQNVRYEAVEILVPSIDAGGAAG